MLSIMERGDDRPGADEFLAAMQAIGSLHRSLLAVGEGIAARAGLTRAQNECLQQVSDAPRTVAAIAGRLGATRQGVQRNADLLVAAELAEYVENPRHRRARLLTPTADGRRALDAVWTTHEAWVRRTADDLTSVEIDALTAQVRALEARVRATPIR